MGGACGPLHSHRLMLQACWLLSGNKMLEAPRSLRSRSCGRQVYFAIMQYGMLSKDSSVASRQHKMAEGRCHFPVAKLPNHDC